MDNIENEKMEDNLIEKIEKIQKNFPNLILPSMGLVKNSDEIKIDGKDYIGRNDVREE
jgi:hypothetical protein